MKIYSKCLTIIKQALLLGGKCIGGFDMKTKCEELTDREKDVLNLLALGYENSEIADILFITIHTVKAHISSLIKKFGARNRTNVITLAIKNGILSL